MLEEKQKGQACKGDGGRLGEEDRRWRDAGPAPLPAARSTYGTEDRGAGGAAGKGWRWEKRKRWGAVCAGLRGDAAGGAPGGGVRARA